MKQFAHHVSAATVEQCAADGVAKVLANFVEEDTHVHGSHFLLNGGCVAESFVGLGGCDAVVLRPHPDVALDFFSPVFIVHCAYRSILATPLLIFCQLSVASANRLRPPLVIR